MTIIKKFEPETQKQSLPKGYIALVSIFLVILIVFEIWASNTVVSFGGKFEKLSLLEKNLKMENQILENEIAKRSSLGVIASKSAELGFLKGQSIQYIP